MSTSPTPRGVVRPQVVAHRGASFDFPEHTPAAYREAIDVGAPALECDIRMTLDRQLVCVHDANVERTSSGKGSLAAMTLAQLQELDWGSWKYLDPDGALPAGQRAVLTLRELFEMVRDAPRRVEIAVETKHPNRYGRAIEDSLAQMLTEFGWDGAATDTTDAAPSPVRMMSFSVLAVRRMRKLTPNLDVVFLMDRLLPPYKDGALPAGARIAGIGLNVLRKDPDYVRRAHEAGNAVHVWTVDDPLDVEACLAADVDAIITNRPREVLKQLDGA